MPSNPEPWPEEQIALTAAPAMTDMQRREALSSPFTIFDHLDRTNPADFRPIFTPTKATDDADPKAVPPLVGIMDD